MKKILIKVIATIFVFFISIIPALAENWIEKTVVDKEFKVENGAKLVIDHEFGEVKCENWDNSSISVVVIVRVSVNDEAKAQKIIDNIFIDVKGSTNKVEASCSLNRKNKGNDKINVNIDFLIKMPSWINLELDSEFGSAYVESIDGISSISSEYGKLEATALNGQENIIEIEFGSGSIGFISKGEIELSYGNLEIKGTEELSIESEYSDVQIDRAEKLSAEIDGGKLSIGKCGVVELESSFSQVNINNLSTSLFAEIEYGGLNVSGISKTFTTINVGNEYGQVKLDIHDDASYVLLAEGSYGNISYPESAATMNYKKTGVNGVTLKGRIGTESNPASKVELSTEFGNIIIQ